ncbi:acyl-ACP--UDP-N-acetylglucosamine O-acyltransferase [Mongoliitalea lutea]|uniref:Acyl-[acyl-carrier-protein]--UDP-N-acetylglucosamine O-acyltransferase n=1 Tax=Mongoliitalea lutea TaxID=849756 RepID=A0A8J3D0G5_9BACT|nr:acyl-ACP--UDP-N-acetylglucosamine O-acyltransferase [Mongoliitalea lutea]GHB42446.1 acyl-[acyl-carrier-protein]--UDP-N-acetylglucosamine O-acyltransferase [Mongoliitalea lutea]
MISNLSHIDPKAIIGTEVHIDPFTMIHEDVIIGEGTWIGSNVTIYPGARIGKNCKIFPGAVIAGIPQDLKFQGEVSTVEIGDNTTIRECVTISRGTIDKRITKVGSNCLLMAYVHIAHDCIVGNNVIIANSVQVAGHVTIDDWAIVGGSSAIHQFVKIGMHSMISGGSLVRKDVPPFTKAAREPLSYAGVNSLGLRRRGFSSESISHIQEVYRYLFLNSLNNSRALEEIEINLPATKERDEIVNFIRSSERGVMKGYIS